MLNKENIDKFIKKAVFHLKEAMDFSVCIAVFLVSVYICFQIALIISEGILWN